MVHHHKEGLDNRTRDDDGQIRRKRSDTLMGTLQKEYGDHHFEGVNPRMKLGNFLEHKGAESLSAYLKSK